MTKSHVRITPSLLNDFDWFLNAPPSWRHKAHKAFIQRLRREKPAGPKPIAMQKGILFEDKIQEVCEITLKTKHCIVTKGSIPFRGVANECIGGKFQQVVKKIITIDNEDVLFYCKLDVLHPHCIIDLKTTANYKGASTYLKSWQHKIYTWVTGRELFYYIVVEWKSEDDYTIKDVHRIEYVVDDMQDNESDIISQVKGLFNYLYKNNLYNDFYFTFSKN